VITLRGGPLDGSEFEEPTDNREFFRLKVISTADNSPGRSRDCYDLIYSLDGEWVSGGEDEPVGSLTRR
jgi:hypothetical protein